MQAIEQQIINIIQNSLRDLGLNVINITLKERDHKIYSNQQNVLEVLIDRLDDKKVSITDCSNASRTISMLLDVENIISDQYLLEVSSPGIERPLIKFEDYTKFIGQEVAIKLNGFINGRNKCQGKIIRAEYNKIFLQKNKEEIVLPFDMIKKASLVLTDEMFKNLINKKS